MMIEQQPVNTPFLIGISGGSASGKSTFVRVLAKTLQETAPDRNLLIINVDHYFHRDATRLPVYFSPSFQMNIPDFNHPDALDIPRLLDDLDVLMVQEPAPDIILVEGHLLFHDAALRERLDARIFIDLDGEIRALRRMVRNLAHPGDPIPDHSPQAIASYYLESARMGYQQYIEPTRQYADLILRGDGDFERTAALVGAMVRGMTFRD